MKKTLLIIIILVLCFIAPAYLFFGGGLDKYCPIIGSPVKSITKGYAGFFMLSLPVTPATNIREGMTIGADFPGNFTASLLDNKIFISPLGGSSVQIEDVQLAADADNKSDNKAEQTGQNTPLTTNATTNASSKDIKQKLNKVVLDDVSGLVFLELFAPMVLEFEGPGVIGKNLRMRIVPNAPNAPLKDFVEPVRILLVKPEEKRGIENILCLDLPDSINLELWLGSKRGFTIANQHQVVFNRTPGQMESEAITSLDLQKTINWLKLQDVWTGDMLEEYLRSSAYQDNMKIVAESLSLLEGKINGLSLSGLQSLVETWALLGRAADDKNAQAPQPLIIPLPEDLGDNSTNDDDNDNNNGKNNTTNIPMQAPMMMDGLMSQDPASSSEPEPAKADAAKPDEAKPDAASPEPVKTEPAKPVAAKPEPAKAPWFNKVNPAKKQVAP